MVNNKVFLGGTLGGPDWRGSITPLLKCPYFNPVVEEWDDAAQEREKKEKSECGISIYVLNPYLNGVFSVAEIVEDSITRRPGRTIVCVLDGYLGKKFTPSARASIDAVTDMVKNYGTIVVYSLQDCAKMVNLLAVSDQQSSYLFKNKWLSLKKMEGPTGEYVYSHEERCSGHIVSILPHKSTPKGNVFLVREEYTPPWGIDRLFCSSFTGGVDKGMDPLETARKELFEESGHDMPLESFVPMGTCRGSKSSDTVYHLFSVDVTNSTNTSDTGVSQDANERLAKNKWVAGIPQDASDPLLYVLYHRWFDTVMDGDTILNGFSWN